MTLNKDNKPIDPKTGDVIKKHSNIPAYIIAGLIALMLLTAGIFFAGEKLSNYIVDNFVQVNLN